MTKIGSKLSGIRTDISTLDRLTLKKFYNKDGYTLIVCLLGGTIKIHAHPSHTEYEFTEECRIVPVRNEDIADLLQKRRTAPPCCVGEQTPEIFKIWENEPKMEDDGFSKKYGELE